MSGTEVLTSVDGVTLTEFFFDTEKLVILGKTFGTARSTSLDLTSTETNNEVSNSGILSFTFKESNVSIKLLISDRSNLKITYQNDVKP